MNRQDQNDRTSKAQKSPTDRGFPAYFRRILIFSIAKCEKNKFFSSIFNRFINKKMFRFKLLKIRRFFFWESFLMRFLFFLGQHRARLNRRSQSRQKTSNPTTSRQSIKTISRCSHVVRFLFEIRLMTFPAFVCVHKESILLLAFVEIPQAMCRRNVNFPRYK